MFFKDRRKKASGTDKRVGFVVTKDGGLSVDRAALHRSENFKRQIEALAEITKRMKRTG